MSKECPRCRKAVADDAVACPGCGLAVASFNDRETDTGGAGPVDNTNGPEPEALTQLGKYQIERLIGRGGVGRIFLAFDPVLNRRVAIKIMVAGEDASEGSIARFMAEAKAAGKLRHPGIVTIYEVGRERALYYMVMDHVEGRTLRDIIRLGGLVDHEIARIIHDTAQALHYAHSEGVIHRDIKPANIMLDEKGAVHLMDFGLARDLHEEKSITRSGDIMGTPVYLNPEQARGKAKAVDARSDVYSLGAVMYELLADCPPATGHNVMEIITQVIEQEPVRPSRIRLGVNRDLELICLKAMRKEPEHRYQSAAEFAEDLQRFMDSEPVRARPLSPVYRLRKIIMKYRRPLAVISVPLAILLAALFFYMEKERANTARAAAEASKKSADAAVKEAEAKKTELEAQLVVEASLRAQKEAELAQKATELDAQKRELAADQKAAEAARKQAEAEEVRLTALKQLADMDERVKKAELAAIASEELRLQAVVSRDQAAEERRQAQAQLADTQKRKDELEKSLIRIQVERAKIQVNLALVEKKKSDLEERLAEAQRRLEAQAARERREWVTVFTENFDGQERLGREWDAGKWGYLRDGALFIDGTAGPAVVWLDLPIVGDAWQVEFDGWTAAEAQQRNDLGVIVKADLRQPDFQSGLEMRFGSRNDGFAGLLVQGTVLLKTGQPVTIEPGHRYHFLITWRDGRIRFEADDQMDENLVIDLSVPMDDLNLPRDNQRQGFWTWDSMIFVDNIHIRRLGPPQVRTYVDVAWEVQETSGSGTAGAIQYLEKQLARFTDEPDRQVCFNAILKFCLNATRSERDDLAPGVVQRYVAAFGYGPPSAVIRKDLLEPFYELCLTRGFIREVDAPRLEQAVRNDPGFAPLVPRFPAP
ncbi:MAG: protein kinase [Planctomycetota bacterium]